MPFHADMIFQLNKTVINARFFESESQELSNCTDSDQKKTSPQHMIDVFMTPQSDEEFSEESMSPQEDSPTQVKSLNSPPVGAFDADNDFNLVDIQKPEKIASIEVTQTAVEVQAKNNNEKNVAIEGSQTQSAFLDMSEEEYKVEKQEGEKEFKQNDEISDTVPEMKKAQQVEYLVAQPIIEKNSPEKEKTEERK